MYTGVINNTEKPVMFTVDQEDFLFHFMTDSVYEIGNPLQEVLLPSKDGFLFGRTHENHTIAIYTGNLNLSVYTTHKLNTGLFILSTGNILCRDFENYTGISFVGGTLNQIFRADRLKFDPVSLEAIIKDDVQSYEIMVNNEQIKITIESNISITQKSAGESVNNTDVTLTLLFDTPRKLTDIFEYYNVIKKTLSFMCFRKNIGFDKIQLIKDSNEYPGINESVGDVFMKDEKDIAIKAWQTNICVNDLNDCFPKLIQLFFEDDPKTKTPILGFLPDNDNDLLRMYPNKVKDICSSLEAEYNYTCKDSNASDQLLRNLQKDVFKTISSFKKEHPEFPDSSYNLIHSSVSNWSLSLRDRILFLYSKYAEEIALVNDSDVMIDEDSIHEMVKYRNAVTHNGFAVLSSPVTETAFYIQSIIYFSVLERIGLSRETIKELCPHRLLR